MGMTEAETLTMARKIALYNIKAIHYIKNRLLEMTPLVQKQLKNEQEKMEILLKNSFPNISVSLLIANSQNSDNHDLTKLDVELINDMLLEESNESSD
jgi:hypothetical protein